MRKRCHTCGQLLDVSFFNKSAQKPDGAAKSCTACVNKRRRELYARNKSDSSREKPSNLRELVKKGDYAAVKCHQRSIPADERAKLLALTVADFKSAPKRPGHTKIARLLIQAGAKPDFHLVCAATVGPHIELIKVLLNAGAELNLFTAAALGNISEARRLLSKNPTSANTFTDYRLLSERGMTPLHYCCRSELGKTGRINETHLFLCASELLKHSSMSVPEFNRNLNPLDLCAARGGNVEIAKLLMKHGWRATSHTLLEAVGHSQRHGRGNYNIASLCLESGVDINEPLDNRTVLHAFAHQGDIVGTEWLVNRGADIDARDNGLNTPLHKACERNSTIAVVKLLLKHGASTTTTNSRGQTALDVALRNDKQDIARYLRVARRAACNRS